MELLLEKELLDAIRENDEGLVVSLLQRGADPNAGLLLGGECCLSLALRTGNERVLDLILQYGRGRFQYTNEQRVKESESPEKTKLMLVVEWCGFKVVDMLLKSAAERFTDLPHLPTFEALLHPSLFYLSPTRTAWETLLSIEEGLRKPSGVDIIAGFSGAIFTTCFYKMGLLPRPFFDALLVRQGILAMPGLIKVILANSTKFGRRRAQEAEVAEEEAREYYFRLRKDLSPMGNSSLSADAGMDLISFDWHVGSRELRKSGYRSPATLTFKAISESDNVTESMVLKLLSHDLLVCQPYNESSLAQVLLSMAIRRGWSHLATFLVDRGTATVRRVSGVCWPRIPTGYAYSLAPRLWSYLPFTRKSGPPVHALHDQYIEGSKINFVSDIYKSQVFSEIVCELKERIYSTSTVAINKLIVIWTALERLDTSGALDRDLIDVILSSMAAKGLRNPTFHKVLALRVEIGMWSGGERFESALFHAVAQKNPHLEIVTDLLKAGYPIHWGGSQPYSPFEIALLENTDSRASQLLLDHGAVIGESPDFNESGLMKAVLEQRSFDKFALLIRLGVSAEPRTLGRVIKGERHMTTTSLWDLYSKALSGLGLAETHPSFVEKETEEITTPSSETKSLPDSKDEAACSGSQPEAKSLENGQSAVRTDSSLAHAQSLELGSPSCQVASYPKGRSYHISETWEQVYGEGRSVRYCGTRGQQTWHHRRRDRIADIVDSLKSEELFQKECSQSTNLDSPDPLGATLLMKVCLQRKPIWVANTLYFLGMDRVQDAIHKSDNNGMTAVHYAAAVGDVDALKVLLFPGNLFSRAVNVWRLQDELSRSRYLPSRPKGFEGEYLERDIVPDSDGPPQSWLDVFEGLPEEAKEKIELPNITFSEWHLTESESCLMPERLESGGKSRTPLHEAALGGMLAAVKFLLLYSGIDPTICDIDGKTAADIALEGDYYDIYYALITHIRGQ